MNYLLAVLTAALLIFTYPKLDIVWFAPVALTPLLIALVRERRTGRRFLLGWIAGIVYWFGLCYWIQYVLFFHGGMGLAASWGAFVLFCLVKALHLGAFALVAGLVISRPWAIVAVPAIWVAIERTHAPLGFAWLTLGNAGIDMGVPMRLAPFTGVYGLSFVFAMMSTAVALIVLRRPRRQLAPLLALGLLFALPKLPEPRRATQSAVLVQPNISETADWTREWVAAMHARIEDLTLKTALDAQYGTPTLIVWPEVPAPMYYFDDAQFRDRVNEIARLTRSYLILNVVARAPDGAPYNSALMVSPAGTPVARYDKVHLVPFGEFVPWPFKSLVAKISTEAGDFAAGSQAVLLPAAGHDIGAFICYESVFPHHVRQFAAKGAQLLVNISNDGWYGKTAARDQHLKIVRMRAAENRRWLLRATNDGITSTIDPTGRLLRNLPSYTEGAARTGFTYIRDLTVYSRFGDWFVWVCAALAAGLVLLSFVPQYTPPEK